MVQMMAMMKMSMMMPLCCFARPPRIQMTDSDRLEGLYCGVPAVGHKLKLRNYKLPLH